MPLWEVVGGADKGGILIREGQDLKSPAIGERLSFGAIVEQLDLAGERLHYKLVAGSGPQEGWASLKVSGKSLVIPKEDEKWVFAEGCPAETSGPVAVDEALKAKIEADAKDKAASFGKFVPKYKVLKFPLEKPLYRIFCFHNAGSAESIYSAKRTPFMDWVLGTGSVEVVALDYPGRQNMLKDPLHNTVETLCPLLLSVIYDKIADGVPYFVWGHSVGTWVSFELLILARKVGLPMPKAVFLNAFPAPHTPEAKRPWRRNAQLNDEQFREEVAAWDVEHFKGPSKAVFREDQWADMYEPMMRADFQLFDEYKFKHDGAPRFDFPLHSWHMEGEHFTTAAMVRLWGDWTNKFYFHTLPMGHLSCLYNDEFKKDFMGKVTSMLKTYVEL